MAQSWRPTLGTDAGVGRVSTAQTLRSAHSDNDRASKNGLGATL
jgi:hypothetical protein